jgi:hypothetical protein
MTLKSRLVGLVTILALFTMAPSSFAQIQISIIPETSSGDINTNHNALASVNGKGDGIIVIGSLLAISDLSTATLMLSFPAPITSVPAGTTNFSSFNAVSGPPFNCTTGGIKPSGTTGINPVFLCSGSTALGLPTADAIRISATGGLFAGVSAVLLNTTANRLEIPLPKAAANSASGSFTVSGTRIDANGLTGAQTVTASVNDSTTGYLIGSPNSGTIISSFGPGIAASGLAVGLAPGNTTIGGVTGNPGAGTATIFTNGSISRSLGSFIITEGCAACWRTATQESQNVASAEMNSSQIRLTFNNVPNGVTLNLTINTGNSSTNSSLFPQFGADLGGACGGCSASTTVTNAANTATISFNASPAAAGGATGTSTSKVETIEVDVAVQPLTAGASITTPGTVSVTATMFPIGTGRDSGGLGLGTSVGGYPQFNEVDVGPLTVVNIVSASTTMLVSLAEDLPPFDTGISIANTTADPFTPGGGGATPKAGTIQFNFFPNNATGTGAGTPFSLTTSSTATFNGMSSDGTLAPGATLSVLLSQLLAAAGHPASATAPFVGYIFIQANFTNAHGVGTITDFKTFSLATNVLVLPPPTTAGRAGNGVESLGF